MPDGDLFFPTDSIYVERSTGTVWESWGPIFKMNPPVSGDFSWVNQGGASFDTSRGGLRLYAPAAATHNMRILAKSQPSKPYTITICVLINGRSQARVGLGWRNSSDGKLSSINILENNSVQYEVLKWNSPTSFNAYYVTATGIPSGGGLFMKPWWLQISDNNTNRIVRISPDGVNFWQIHSIGNTDFLTADQVMLYCNSGTATSPTGDVYGWFLHWKES